MFKYTCATCDSPAKKPACVRPKTGSGESAAATLGTWHCTGGCKGKVKVKRSKE